MNTPPQGLTASYVGSAACKTYHPATYASWSKTRMANVVTDPAVHPEVILPDLTKPNPLVTFKKQDIHSSMAQSGNSDTSRRSATTTSPSARPRGCDGPSLVRLQRCRKELIGGHSSIPRETHSTPLARFVTAAIQSITKSRQKRSRSGKSAAKNVRDWEGSTSGGRHA